MKKISLFILVLVFYSCQHAPNVTDENVKKLAIKSAKEKIITDFNFYQKMLVEYALTKTEKDVNDLLKSAWLFSNADKDNMRDLYNHGNDEKIAKIIDSAYNAGYIKIENIRINEINKEIKKSYCDADLILGLLKYGITYTAQYSESGEINVETWFKSDN